MRKDNFSKLDHIVIFSKSWLNSDLKNNIIYIFYINLIILPVIEFDVVDFSDVKIEFHLLVKIIRDQHLFEDPRDTSFRYTKTF